MSNFTTQLKTVKTRKKHHCCAFDCIWESGYATDLDEEDRKEFDRMRDLAGIIPAGTERYSWSWCIDNEMFTAWADKAMYRIASENDLWPEL